MSADPSVHRHDAWEVFFYEAFEEETEALQRYLAPQLRVGFTRKTIQEYGHKQPAAPLICIRTQSAIPLPWATKLGGILSRSTGYDHLERYLAQCKLDLPCGYLPLYCSRSAAEHAVLLSMSLVRRLPQQIGHFATFNRDGLTGRECENKTLLVVGVGNIGYEVARIGVGLGMKVLGVDIVQRHSSVSYVSIEDGLLKADMIVCAMNLTPDNVGYFNYPLLKRAKAGAVFVNVSRGEQSPSRDLLLLLDEGHLGGVALDVYDSERELADSLREGRPSTDEEVKATLRLAERPNTILTPHNAFNTREAVDRKASHSVKQIEHFLEHGSFQWPVPAGGGR